MSSDFSRCLSLLRQKKGISQRAVAEDLGISQVLLSHYEDGVRESGPAFVTKIRNYYNVSANFLLGRTLSRDGTTTVTEELYDYSTEKDNVLHDSVMATPDKKPLVNSIDVLFGLLSRTGRKEAINATAGCLGTTACKMSRHPYRADDSKNENFFSVPAWQSMTNVTTVDIIYIGAQYVDIPAIHVKKEGNFPPMYSDVLMENCPRLCQFPLQIIHDIGERVNHRTEIQNQKQGAVSRTCRLFIGCAWGHHRYHVFEQPERPQQEYVERHSNIDRRFHIFGDVSL